MAEQRNADRKKVSLKIMNQDSTPLRLYVEPWADKHEIPPGGTVRIDFLAPTLEPIPIIYNRGSVTVEGWEGSVAYVWGDGEPLS
jgi:hypothetical protein